jgi:hypothetical protein
VNTPDLFDVGSVTSRLKSEFDSERLPLTQQMVRLLEQLREVELKEEPHPQDQPGQGPNADKKIHPSL